MAERTTELTPLAKIILGGTAGVIVLSGVVFGGAALLDSGNDNQLVILKADTSDYKKAPADKGGLKINSIDSPVLSLLDKAEELEDGVEILRPPVSEPEPPPIDVTEENAPSEEDTASIETPQTTDPASEPKAEIEIIEPSADDGETASAEPVQEESTVKAAEVQPITPAETEETQEPAAESDDEITAAIENLPAKRPNTPKIVATTDVNSPSYVVQFAAFKNETRAKNTAALLSTKHKSRLDDVAIGYMRWGDYWRVVAEPMPRAEANAFCSKFRSVGQECIIKLMESPNG